MATAKSDKTASKRVADYRKRSKERGWVQISLVVPDSQRHLVLDLARRLRERDEILGGSRDDGTLPLPFDGEDEA